MFKLKNWAVISTTNSKKRLTGLIYGHPRIKDGSEIVTTSIIDVNGRQISTSSGSCYLLDGDPESNYFLWMKQNGYVYDKINPIKIVDLNDLKN